MRCQGKMICHTVRWCTLYFTVHFSVILSPVARNGSALGGRTGHFPYALREPRADFPLLFVRSTQNQLPFCSLISAMQTFLSTISAQETQQQSNPVPPRGQCQATCTQNTTRGLWPARCVPTGAECARDTWPQPLADCPHLALTLMPQTAREANKSSPMSAFYIKLTFIYLFCF